MRSIRGRQYVARGPDVYELNDVAAEIWRRCDGSHSASDIARALHESYDVELERVQADVLGLVEELLRMHLVEVAPAGSGGR